MLRIANANMVKAIRLVTVERGFDPREFGLVAFGGAGPLHAVDLARELQMPEVIVPAHPGVTSALGLLFVDPLDDFSWSYVRRQDQIDLAQLRERYEEMDNRVRDSLVRQGVAADAIAVDRSIDLRYIGQLHSVTVPLTEISEAGFAAATAAFHDEHLRQYRYSHPDAPVETSALRVAARGTRAKPDLSRMRDGSDRRAAVAERERPVHFGEQRLALDPGRRPELARPRRRSPRAGDRRPARLHYRAPARHRGARRRGRQRDHLDRRRHMTQRRRAHQRAGAA